MDSWMDSTGDGVDSNYTDAMKKQFAQWLEGEISSRSWTQAEFARKAKVTASQVTRVLTMESGAGLDFYRGTAKAFNKPLEDVLRIAGVLPQIRASDTVAALIHRLETFPQPTQDRIILLLRIGMDLTDSSGGGAAVDDAAADQAQLRQLSAGASREVLLRHARELEERAAALRAEATPVRRTVRRLYGHRGAGGQVRRRNSR